MTPGRLEGPTLVRRSRAQSEFGWTPNRIWTPGATPFPCLTKLVRQQRCRTLASNSFAFTKAPATRVFCLTLKSLSEMTALQTLTRIGRASALARISDITDPLAVCRQPTCLVVRGIPGRSFACASDLKGGICLALRTIVLHACRCRSCPKAPPPPRLASETTRRRRFLSIQAPSSSLLGSRKTDDSLTERTMPASAQPGLDTVTTFEQQGLWRTHSQQKLTSRTKSNKVVSRS